MKLVTKSSVYLMGLLGLFSASGALVHAAENTGDQTTTVTTASQPVIINGTLLETLPAADQDQLNNSMAKLQDKYGETLNQMVLEIQSGQLQVIGLSPNLEKAMGRGSPTSA